MTTIDGLYLNTRPDADTLPAYTRITLSTPHAVDSTLILAPCVIGIDSGYMVAWGSTNGIQVVAVRDVPGLTEQDVSNPLRVVAQNVTISTYTPKTTKLDTLALFPSLGYRPNFESHPDYAYTLWHQVGLAWQQGTSPGPFILYTGVSTYFGAGGKPPIIRHPDIEHISRNLPSCSFRHPCVAVDSLRVGVSFEMLPRIAYSRDLAQANTWQVVLRFRDSINDSGQNVWLRWNTPAYSWSNGTASYLWPSVTQFPSVVRDSLVDAARGGLVWMTDDGSPNTGRILYRYGDCGVMPMSSGAYATMVMAPFMGGNDPWSASGIFYRDPDADAFQAARHFGGTGWYYAGRYENTPAIPSPFFTSPSPAGRRIYANVVVTKMIRVGEESCDIPGIIGGVRIPKPDGCLTCDPIVPGIASTFFKCPTGGATNITRAADAADITRTASFPAGADTITIERFFSGSDSLIAWLDSEPFDSTHGKDADIMFVTELVRTSDDYVLWTGDTLSARTIGDSMLLDEVTVPMDAAEVDTLIYIRLRTFTTDSMKYDATAGFAFYEDDEEVVPRRVIPGSDANGHRDPQPDLSLRMIPNPLRSSKGEVRLHVEHEGHVELWLSDVAGRRMRSLPSLEATRPGEYALAVDLGDLPDGAYVARAQ